jgi:hypothetical protein
MLLLPSFISKVSRFLKSGGSMKNHSVSERGQVLVLIALAIIGLVGITGVAIDGSMILADRRHAQNAADTAAMAGALAKIQAQETMTELAARAPMRVAALDRAISNGYYPDLVSSQVEVYTCDEAGASCPTPYDGESEYVQVIITSNVDTFFARVVGITQLHNRVQALALADDDDSGPLYNGDSIISLAQECENPVNFLVNGGADVVLDGGGLYVNTDDPACGFTCNSNATEITGDITTAGGSIDTSASCSENISGETSTEGIQWDFPVTLDDIGMDIPPECSGPAGTYKNYPAGTHPDYPTTDVSVLTPGSYADFPPKKEIEEGKLYNNIHMNPGVYCVDNVIKLTETNLVLYGHDVTLFLRAGNYFSINGGLITLDAPDVGDYAGYLIVVEPDYSSSPESCTINGNTANSYTGTIFAPYCDCTINGGSEPTGYNAQVICYTVKLSGTSTINFTYDPGENAELDLPPQIGIPR